MDGSHNRRTTSDRPIEKPDFPLPMIFNPEKRSEWATKPRNESQSRQERAHFYLKQVDENGQPTYGFYITREPADRKAAN